MIVVILWVHQDHRVQLVRLDLKAQKVLKVKRVILVKREIRVTQEFKVSLVSKDHRVSKVFKDLQAQIALFLAHKDRLAQTAFLLL